MASINVCTFTGRAGRDPEVRYFESGKVLAEFSIAVDGFKRDDEPTWVKLKIWGKSAQVAADYVRKGSMVGVSGRLETERWTDHTTGEPRTKDVLNVQSLTLLDGKPKEEGSYGGAPAGESANPYQDDSSIPF